ncbi:M16 family metallopeptidase [Litorimonas sp. RW-G-Af-16]|uniref:M16 family metallopeptidase n=1 Tax=Litorimonas sp. RW-G-Af-16 TaxID=3241168 RepID=UPI003AAB2DD1
MTFSLSKFDLRDGCLALGGLMLAACADGISGPAAQADLNLNYEKITLENGLDVVFHIDRSDPVVAINLAAHVGSARETEGNTGFAHLFEHLLFLDSENLGYGGLDEMNTRIGGEGTNGFTTYDMTQYFQAVPKDALEKVIWAEADKLGWFINTVSQDVIDKEKQVVKNEKRQRVDNQPYGHWNYIANKTLYPSDHPYSWTVIGSLADLEAASLQETKDFYARWYVPSNVTVSITGDFDMAEAKAWVEKYFGEIPAGDQEIEPYAPRASNLTETTSLYYEDNFATVPLLLIAYPTVEQYHPDSYALDVLSEYLTEGKRAPLNEVLIDEAKVTSDVSSFQSNKEIAGELYFFVSPNDGEDIDGLMAPLADGFARFEETGIPQAALDRIKTQSEVSFYEEVQSALGKAIQLSEYNLFTDNPGFYKKDLEGLQSVTTDDVMRVYNKYIKDQPRLYLSIVPKGETELKLDETYPAQLAEIVEEKVVPGAETEKEFDPAARIIANPTTSAFDRSIEPEFGAAYDLTAPDVWRKTLDNGLEVYGITSNETPLVNFSLKLDAGRIRSSVDQPAIAGLTADLLQKGTVNKTTAEMEEAIGALGSTITVRAGDYGTFVSGTTLSRNLDATLDLAKEMLFEPRWDAEEFALLKDKRIQEISQAEGDPNSIARREAALLAFPSDHVFSHAGYGPKDLLEAVTLDDLKAFHAAHYDLSRAQFRVVGAVEPETDFGLDTPQDSSDVPPVSPPKLNSVTSAEIYLYDVPGAKQSVLRIARPSLAATDPDYPLAEAINFPLGGIYTSKLNTQLRVDKGYTYGIRSTFNGDKDIGQFQVGSSVRTNVTKESIALIRDILASYGPDFTQEELDTMKGALLRGQALKSETNADKLGLLGQISAYGYAPDFRAQNAKAINAMTLDDFKALAEKYIRPDAMTYLVVGDAATQTAPLSELGLGDPIMLETK